MILLSEPKAQPRRRSAAHVAGLVRHVLREGDLLLEEASDLLRVAEAEGRVHDLHAVPSHLFEKSHRS